MKSILSQLVFITTLILPPLAAFAAQQKIPYSVETEKQLSIASVEVLDLTSQYEANPDFYEYYTLMNQLSSTPIGGALDQADLVVDKVINIGQKIWNVIEKGKPTAKYSNSKATALPANATRWDQLANWQTPRSKVISIIYKNFYGMEVVRFTYRITLLYGGSVRGTGRYIGYAAVEPVEITTSYMYDFNAVARVDAVYNTGTSLNPVAGMILNISWTVETVVKKITETHTYNLDGLGNIEPPTSLKFSDISSLR